jgi:hypothetical protein
MLSTAVLDLDAEVTPFVAYRSDASANNKWRVWWYYTRASDGFLVPFTPDTTTTGALYVPQVVLLLSVPASAGFQNGVSGVGPLEVVFGVVGDIANLGTKAIGLSGRVADAAHVHQIGTATPQALGTAAVGNSTTPSPDNHVHQMPTKDQVPETYTDGGTAVQQTAGAATAVLQNVALSDDTIYLLEAIVYIRGTSTTFSEYLLSQTWSRANAGGATQQGSEMGPIPNDGIGDCIGATLVANSNGVDLKCGPSATQNCNVRWTLNVVAKALAHR